VDYRSVSCPVCEQVCRDAAWIPHHVLLAEPEQIKLAAAAIRKVIQYADRLRET
jgi:hypothetical protein